MLPVCLQSHWLESRATQNPAEVHLCSLLRVAWLLTVKTPHTLRITMSTPNLSAFIMTILKVTPMHSSLLPTPCQYTLALTPEASNKGLPDQRFVAEVTCRTIHNISCRRKHISQLGVVCTLACEVEAGFETSLVQDSQRSYTEKLLS